MRRKLIKQDAFDRMTNESVTTAERELVEAAPALAKALGTEHIALHGFTESTVVYETPNDTYVHAGYELKESKITFNNIEELVIDESSRKTKMRGMLSEMLDSILKDEHAQATAQFQDYLGMVRWNENVQIRNKATNDKSHRDDNHRANVLQAAKAAGFDNAYVTSQNVLEYVEFMKVGPTLRESTLKTDKAGNVVGMLMPTINERNKNKVQSFKWKTINADNHQVRESVAALSQDQNFCKAISDLKRQNAFSDQKSLEESLDHVVSTWPSLLYVTQSELAQIVSEALHTAGARNYEDKTCVFMAEGLLRKAHSAYTEKVNQILHLAGASRCDEETDPYAHFQGVVEQFYPTLDEQFGLERKVFSDLYETYQGLYKMAERRDEKSIMKQSASYLNELADVLNENIKPDLLLVEEAATWLAQFVEANVQYASEKWDVSNTPHLTVSGDHPHMARNAKVPAIAGRHDGEWGDSAPAIGQDNHNYKGGKNAKTMRNNSWGQEGGGEVFPKLKNPYVPKPFGDYTMKGEKGVDKDATGQHWSTWQTSDTWPDLQNPYVPGEAGGEGGSGHKMKNGPETDLVVDK